MKQGFNRVINTTDDNDNPTGGLVSGTGITIVWQDGPLGRDGDRIKPNGAFVEDVIEAARQRIAFFQTSKYECADNADAVAYLEGALNALNRRTEDRENRGVEGTHEE